MADSQPSRSHSGGIGIVGLLTIMFVVLKLAGVIHWPWLWVLAPLWMPFVAGVVVFVLFVVVVILAKCLDG